MSSTRRCRLAAVAAAVVLALAAASCGGGDGVSSSSSEQPEKPGSLGQTVTIVELEPFAIAPADLPDGFKEKQRQTEETAQTCLTPADDIEKDLADRIDGFGLLGCQAVTYEHRLGGEIDLAGTFALLFKDTAGAEGALPLVRDILVKSYRASGNAKVVSVTELGVPALGDQALPGVLFKLAVGDAEKDHSVYVWRRGRVVDVFAVANFLNQIGPDAAREIATKVDTRAGG